MFRVSNFYKHFKENEKTNFLGFAEIEVCDDGGTALLRIVSIALYQRTDDQTFYLQFPNAKGKDEKWRDLIYPTTGEGRKYFTDLVVEKAKETWSTQN
jgi:hypothetical protein